MSLEKSTSRVRPVIIVGNWKMYKTIQEALEFVETLTPLVAGSQATLYLAVPFTAIRPMVQKVAELKVPFYIGGQNMNDASEGAFTGEIAGRMLKEAGAQFVILGHSERRRLFHEEDGLINKKIKRAYQEGLRPILCIGETAEERDQGQTEAVLKHQLDQCLKGITAKRATQLILAYEPIWAIGTGKVATAEEAEEVHNFCREWAAAKWSNEVANQLIIQYGGSVKPENAKSFWEQPDIDGLLVGGASLSADSFSEIVNSYQKVNS